MLQLSLSWKLLATSLALQVCFPLELLFMKIHLVEIFGSGSMMCTLFSNQLWSLFFLISSRSSLEGEVIIFSTSQEERSYLVYSASLVRHFDTPCSKFTQKSSSRVFSSQTNSQFLYLNSQNNITCKNYPQKWRKGKYKDILGE